MSQSGVSTAGKCVDFLFGTQGGTLNKLSNKITLNIIVNAFFKKAKYLVSWIHDLLLS